MSFSFSFTGKRDAVVKAVQETKGYGDESQLNRAKKAVLAELDALPENVGVQVQANGSHYYSQQSPYGNVSVSVNTITIVE